MNKAEILIIDDEAEMSRLLEITLESHDYKVIKAMRAKEGLIMAANHPPDLILLDLGLPDASGHEVLEKLRTWFEKPVIILSVINNEADIVKALDHGANDYLVKPFRTGELLARIRSALRVPEKGRQSRIFTVNGLHIDFELRLIKKNHELLKLTATEYNLLTLLVKNEGRVLTHRFILREVWGPAFQDQTQYLRVYIAQLRKKIEDNPNDAQLILTEPGVGYRFTTGK